MTNNPQSYRVPVLRLSDVVAGNDPDDDNLEIETGVKEKLASADVSSKLTADQGAVSVSPVAPRTARVEPMVVNKPSESVTLIDQTSRLQEQAVVDDTMTRAASESVDDDIFIDSNNIEDPTTSIPEQSKSVPTSTVSIAPVDTEQVLRNDTSTSIGMLAQANNDEDLPLQPLVNNEVVQESVPVVPTIGYDIPDMWDTAAVTPPHTPQPKVVISKVAEISEPVVPTFTPSKPLVEQDPVIEVNAVIPTTKKAQVSGTNLATLRERILQQSVSTPVVATQEKISTDVTGVQTGITSPETTDTPPPSTSMHVLTTPPDTSAQIDAEEPPTNRALPDSTHARAIAQVALSLHTPPHDTKLPENGTPAPETIAATGALTSAPLSSSGPLKPLATNSQTVPAMRTLKSDVANMVSHNQTSVVDMISAEEQKKGVVTPTIRMASQSRLTSSSYILIGASVALLFGALIVGAIYYFSRTVDAPPLQKTFFYTEQSQVYDVTKKEGKNVLTDLANIRDTANMSVGFITEVHIQETTHLLTVGRDETLPISLQKFFERIGAHIPSTLTRAMSDKLMVGFYRSNKNQPFIIFNVDDYANAFSGMLEWEATMGKDLSPLFDTGTLPSPEKAAVHQELVSTTTAATSTATTSATLPKTMPRTGTFEDRTVANVPVRVLTNAAGDIVLLWTMPDNATVMITTNEDALQNVRGRMTVRQF